MQRIFATILLIGAATLAHAQAPAPGFDAKALGAVTFHSGSSRVSQPALSELHGIATWHQKNPNSLLIIEGHASPPGSRQANLELSQERAEAVRGALVRAGADSARMVVVAFGEDLATDADARPRVVIRASGEFVELAREQRDPDIAEDARAAGRTTDTRRIVDRGGAAATSEPTPSGTTVIVVPRTSATDGAAAPTPMQGDSAFPGTDADISGGAGPTDGGLGASALRGTGIDPTTNESLQPGAPFVPYVTGGAVPVETGPGGASGGGAGETGGAR